MSQQSGVEQAISAAGSGAKLAERWGVSPMAITKFKQQGWFPLDRAKIAAEQFNIPLRDLVAPNIRDAMDRA
jgi:hypothetical protein